jgi:hypothetical protein
MLLDEDYFEVYYILKKAKKFSNLFFKFVLAFFLTINFDLYDNHPFFFNINKVWIEEQHFIIKLILI